MNSKRKLILLIPTLNNKKDVVGGQVTAARGLINYLETHHIPYRVVDTAFLSNSNYRLVRVFGKLNVLLKSMCLGFFFKFDAALFFKSTHKGLLERFLPAVLFRLRGIQVGLFFRNSDIFNLAKKGVKVWLITQLLRPYSIFFVQGESWKEHLVCMGFSASRVFVVPNWLPPEFSMAPRSKVEVRSPIRFVFTGKIVKEKGVFEILDALSSESLKGKCEFVFAGDGPDLEKCKALVSRYELNGVVFMGALSKDAVLELLNECDVFVMPSYQEGFPNSVLEAMAIGLPIIATDVGALSESVSDGVNGFIVSVKSSSDLVRRMKCYIDHPELIQSHSQASLEVTLKRHDRNGNIERLLSCLR